MTETDELERITNFIEMAFSEEPEHIDDVYFRAMNVQMMTHGRLLKNANVTSKNPTGRSSLHLTRFLSKLDEVVGHDGTLYIIDKINAGTSSANKRGIQYRAHRVREPLDTC